MRACMYNPFHLLVTDDGEASTCRRDHALCQRPRLALLHINNSHCHSPLYFFKSFYRQNSPEYLSDLNSKGSFTEKGVGAPRFSRLSELPELVCSQHHLMPASPASVCSGQLETLLKTDSDVWGFWGGVGDLAFLPRFPGLIPCWSRDHISAYKSLTQGLQTTVWKIKFIAHSHAHWFAYCGCFHPTTVKSSSWDRD